MNEQSQPEVLTDTVPSLPPEAVYLVSGLVYQVLRPGTGDERPGPEDVVQAVIEAKNEAGRGFEPGERTFSLQESIPGLAEAFQLMTVGQKLRVWIPPHLASDESHEKPDGPLILDLELVGFTRMKEPPSIPHELTSPRREE